MTMNLKGVPESPNFTDDTTISKMMQNLLMYNPYQRFNDAEPINYKDWLTSRLKNMSPQDQYLMYKKGFSITDLDNYHNMMNGGQPDPTIPMLKK